MMVGEKKNVGHDIMNQNLDQSQAGLSFVPPHPNPLPWGEGETFGRAFKIRQPIARRLLGLGTTGMVILAFGMSSICAETRNAKVEIRCVASYRMIQLVGAWAEAYRNVQPNVFVNVSNARNPEIYFSDHIFSPEKRRILGSRLR
jgi:hypothetical protein